MLWSLTTGWLLPLTLHRIHFQKAQTSSSLLMKALQIWDRAGSRLFFSVAVLTTVKCDLFKTRYMLLRGGRGELRTVLKGNMSDGCQPFLDMCSSFHICKFFLWFSSFLHFYFRKTNSHKRSKQPCGRHMLEMGWFKLINVLWDLFVLLDVWTHLVQWACSSIAIWWNPGVSSLLIVLSVQSHSCQGSKSGKWYL